MISYRDRTYCLAKDCKRFGVDCDRALTEEVRKAADAAGLPVSWVLVFSECYVWPEENECD